MNITNLNRLKAWLEEGAPHANFDMSEGIEIKPSCGTSCCIAGAAAQMSINDDGTFPTQDQIMGQFTHFEDMSEGEFATCFGFIQIAEAALDWLGLNKGSMSFYHDLFDNSLAPENCTPAQAAMAVQNVIDGKPAWAGII